MTSLVLARHCFREPPPWRESTQPRAQTLLRGEECCDDLVQMLPNLKLLVSLLRTMWLTAVTCNMALALLLSMHQLHSSRPTSFLLPSQTMLPSVRSSLTSEQLTTRIGTMASARLRLKRLSSLPAGYERSKFAHINPVQVVMRLIS